MALAQHFRKKSNKKHFYGLSMAGTGKSTGAIMNIFHEAMLTDPLLMKPYILVTSTYCNAYSLCRFAVAFSNHFAAKREFEIGFMSKGSVDLEKPFRKFDLIIGTPNEIIEKLEELEDPSTSQSSKIDTVIFDDCDGYLSMAKIESSFMKKISYHQTRFIVLGQCHVPEILNILPATDTVTWSDDEISNSKRYIEFGNRNEQSELSMDIKIQHIKQLIVSTTKHCPTGQILIFCKVRNHFVLKGAHVQ